MDMDEEENRESKTSEEERESNVDRTPAFTPEGRNVSEQRGGGREEESEEQSQARGNRGERRGERGQR